MASDRGLHADFHVDETGDPSVATLRMIAETVIETGFDAPVVVGHCCSLAVQDEAEALHTLDLVAKAGLNVVSLPMCNLYLQDRTANRTPRWRGITLVHEMKARGINVSFASDNTRDPFYAYGDLDMVEVMRAGDPHRPPRPFGRRLDPRLPRKPRPRLRLPRGLARPRRARRPRHLPRAGMDRTLRPPAVRPHRPAQWPAIDRTLPDYAELDHLMRTA